MTPSDSSAGLWFARALFLAGDIDGASAQLNAYDSAQKLKEIYRKTAR